MSPRLVAGEGGRFRLEGDLTMASVPGLWRDSRGFLDRAPQAVVVDLAAAGRCDSAALALLVEWLRAARRAGRELRFAHLPADLLAIARVCGLLDLLPLEDGA